GAVSRPHGGTDPGDPRALGGGPFFVGSNFTMQSTSLHVAIIMDGNGRWATRRGLPRAAGHHAGARAVRRIVEAAPGLGIGQLTLFAFSADNWKRPPDEVAALMRLFGRHLPDRYWPGFGAAELAAAIREFRRRQRRFGGLPETAAG